MVVFDGNLCICWFLITQCDDIHQVKCVLPSQMHV